MQVKKRRNVTIIVPVYGDWVSLEKCIDSLIININKTDKVIFANDHGPDYLMIGENIKNKIMGISNFHYFENSTNLGFLQNCNKAVMQYDKSNNDIILLNSDTVTTESFVDELSKVAYSDDRIATVCPRSNDATIASMPIRSCDTQKNISAKKSYDIYKYVHTLLPSYVISPVSVGFCFFIKRSVIQEHGLFDEVYKKGYGEEDDFCMRMNQQGYISAIANHAFVFHQGARSFTPELREKLTNENARTLIERFPYFPKIVSIFLEYQLAAVEHFAETVYSLKNKSKYKILIDLHSLPAHEIGYTAEVKDFLEALEHKNADISIVTSGRTRSYLNIENENLSWIEPHLLSGQYDISYSLLPIGDLNNIRMLRNVAFMNTFHNRCVDDMYKNDKMVNMQLQQAKEVVLGYADGYCNDTKSALDFIIAICNEGPDYHKIQERWERLNIIFRAISFEPSIETSDKKIIFVKRYYQAFRRKAGGVVKQFDTKSFS